MPASATDKIQAALDSGTIDFATSILYRLFANVGDPRLPAEFSGPVEEDDLLPYLVADDPSIQLPAEIRAQMEPYLLRPTDPLSAYHNAPAEAVAAQSAGAAGGPPVAALPCVDGWASRNSTVPIKVWAQCTGDFEAAISAGVAAANAVYRPMSAYMGDPVLDAGGQFGGLDESIDVYLTNDSICPDDAIRCFNIPGGANGVARSWEPFNSRVPGSSSGFFVIRRSLLGDPNQFRRTFIHEFFHILQKAHNRPIMTRPSGTDKDGNITFVPFWFTEASATWASYYFEMKAGRTPSAAWVPQERFIKGFQPSDLSLDATSPESQPYQAWIWPYFMVQEQGEGVVAHVWQALEGETNYSSAMDTISDFVPFPLKFREFAVRNINTDVSGGSGDPIETRYKAGDDQFPDGRPSGGKWLGPAVIEPTEEPNVFIDRIKPLSANYWRFTVDDSVERFEFDFSGLGSEDALDVDALLGLRQEGGGLKWEHRRLSEPKARFCRSIPEEDVGELYLVLSNHERDGFMLDGQYTVEATDSPCRGFEVTFVRETTGGPDDPTRLVLHAILEPDEEGEDDGLLEAHGTGTGSYLIGDLEHGGCKAESYSGIVKFAAELTDPEHLYVTAVAIDPFIVDLYGGTVPKEGGEARDQRPPLLAPGDPMSGIPPCDAYSLVSQTLTVRVLNPE